MAEFTKEQLIEHAQAESAALKAMIEHGGYSDDVVDFLKHKMQLDEIALAALTAEPEEYIFDHPHGKLFRSISDKNNAGMPGVFPVYRLPLLEGLK